MNRFSPLEKPCKFDNHTPSLRILQSTMCSVDNSILSKNEQDKIKIIKIESVTSQQLKRRRSRSHNLLEYSNGNLLNGDQNNIPYPVKSFETCKNFTQSSNNPSSTNNQWIKEKHKKETHNRVERKRRDFINGQIQKLADLLPSELFFNYDLKMNKGLILKNSVEYISSMKSVEKINRQLVLENELGSRLIRILIAFNDLNCSELSINEDISEPQSKEDVDINIMITEWNSIHQENKELLKQFSQQVSNAFSESKNEMTYEKISTLETTNNNPTVVHSSSRKRYSSMPTDISNDFHGSKNVTAASMVDKSSPILNSLLKKPDIHHQTINEPSFSIEIIDDSINCYLQCTSAPSLNEDINMDTVTVIEPQIPHSNNNERLFQIKNKMYYTLPKSAKSNCNNHDNSELLPREPTGSPSQNNHDPMLLSDQLIFDNV